MAPLVAHTFRIEQETLDELDRLGHGNASLGARIALERSRSQSLRTFMWGVLTGFTSSVLAHLIFTLVSEMGG